MKCSIILFTDDPKMAQHAKEIDIFLDQFSYPMVGFELCLVYGRSAPELIPEFSMKFSTTRLITIGSMLPPESIIAKLQVIFDQNTADIIVFPSSNLGKELATRLAYRLKGSSCTGVESIWMKSNQITIRKPAYGNHLTAELLITKQPFCVSVAKHPELSVRMTAIEEPVISHQSFESFNADWIIDSNIETSSKVTANLLSKAQKVVVIGQGVNSQKKVDRLRQFASSIGAEIAGSRPVVMNGWLPMDCLIGVSGQVIAPKLCIVIGVSGSAVFTTGIIKSGAIIAINTDSNAPIFNIADVGLVGDFEEAITEWERLLDIP